MHPPAFCAINWRAAAFERRVDVRNTEPRGGIVGERGRTARFVAPEIDDRADAQPAHQSGKAHGRRVVGAIEPPGNDNRPVVPGDAEEGVIDEDAVEPRG